MQESSPPLRAISIAYALRIGEETMGRYRAFLALLAALAVALIAATPYAHWLNLLTAWLVLVAATAYSLPRAFPRRGHRNG